MRYSKPNKTRIRLGGDLLVTNWEDGNSIRMEFVPELSTRRTTRRQPVDELAPLVHSSLMLEEP